MAKKTLNHKLDCKSCGTILLDIPDDATEGTAIHCSQCGGYIGDWGELQDDFLKQSGHGAFELNDGRITEA